jgi:hypothetical protein
MIRSYGPLLRRPTFQPLSQPAYYFLDYKCASPECGINTRRLCTGKSKLYEFYPELQVHYVNKESTWYNGGGSTHYDEISSLLLRQNISRSRTTKYELIIW